MEDIQYLLAIEENDAGPSIVRALSRARRCNAMRVVFFDAAHARSITENIFTFPLYATRFSRMLKKSLFSLAQPCGCFTRPR
jgi:hypothetical protein